MNGETNFEELQQHAVQYGEPELQSGRQETLENTLSEYVSKGPDRACFVIAAAVVG